MAPLVSCMQITLRETRTDFQISVIGDLSVGSSRGAFLVWSLVATSAVRMVSRIVFLVVLLLQLEVVTPQTSTNNNGKRCLLIIWFGKLSACQNTVFILFEIFLTQSQSSLLSFMSHMDFITRGLRANIGCVTFMSLYLSIMWGC